MTTLTVPLILALLAALCALVATLILRRQRDQARQDADATNISCGFLRDRITTLDSRLEEHQRLLNEAVAVNAEISEYLNGVLAALTRDGLDAVTIDHLITGRVKVAHFAVKTKKKQAPRTPKEAT